MKNTVNLFFAFFPFLSGLSQMPTFKYHKIGEFGNRMGQTSLVDVDNDTDLDWVFGRFGAMYWYEYIAADDWRFHEMGNGAITDVGGVLWM